MAPFRRSIIAFAAAIAAIEGLIFVAVLLLWPAFGDKANSPLNAALHVTYLSSFVVLIGTICLCAPLYVVFYKLGWLSRRRIIAASILVAEIYPIINWQPNRVTEAIFTSLAMAVLGAVGSVAFCSVLNLPHKVS